MIDKITPDITIQRHKKELLSLLAEATAQVESIPDFEGEENVYNDNEKRQYFNESVKNLRKTLKTIRLTFDVLVLELPTKSESICIKE